MIGDGVQAPQEKKKLLLSEKLAKIYPKSIRFFLAHI